jgi:hypothetical protein
VQREKNHKDILDRLPRNTYISCDEMSAVCSYTDAYYNVISYSCKDQLTQHHPQGAQARQKYDDLTKNTPIAYSIWLVGDVLSFWNEHFGDHIFDNDDPDCCGDDEGCSEETCFTTGLLENRAEKLRLFEHLWNSSGIHTTDTVKTEILDRHDDFFTCGFDYRRSPSDLRKAANPRYCCQMDLSEPDKNQTNQAKVWETVSCGWKALQHPDEIPRFLGFTITLTFLRLVRELLDIWVLHGAHVKPAQFAGTLRRLIYRFATFLLLIASWTGCDHNECTQNNTILGTVNWIPFLETLRKFTHQLLRDMLPDEWTERLFVVLAGSVIVVEVVASAPSVVFNIAKAVLPQRHIDAFEKFEAKYLRYCLPDYAKIRGEQAHIRSNLS